MNENYPVTHPWLTHFFDRHFASEVVKIKPGEYFATTAPCIITTVLGSCVAACIRDVVRGGAGMNHFMLPRDMGSEDDAPPGFRSLCYGMSAMESLINEFIKHGSQRRDLQAKVFGGSAVLPFTLMDVGKQNASFVLEYLGTERIPAAAVDLGGVFPRKVLLFTATGEVLVKYLSRLTNDTIEKREVEYAQSLRDLAKGEFELL